MNISKALKVKNRLINEVNTLQQVFQRENSRRDDNLSTIDNADIQKKLEQSRAKLVSLKGSLNRASAAIGDKLAFLAETKSQINFYKSLPCREGEEVTLIGSNREKLTYQWSAHLNRQKIDEITSQLQSLIDKTQDEIDDFNAKTHVDYAEI